MLDMEEIYEEEESDNESFAKEVNNETTSVKGENSEDEENGRKGDGNTKEKRSITEPKSKKSSKGIDKKLKKWGSAIMQPLMPNVNWKVDFNLGVKASNQKDEG
uniref:Uncharacterized protein n=1 Tax=Anopheles gambiae TaxID=7165 RepID=A0A903XVQ0_ANOGA